MKLLRSEKGCPWDRVQTHASIRNNFLEEVYEVLDAIDRESDTDLCEELGDVLLQVVFHAQMANEAGNFDLDQVADGICKKLILRHPHVFSDVVAETPEKVLENWDNIKKVEKGQDTYTDSLESVPKVFPALMRAQKVQKRAAKAGFDWPDVSGALDKIDEETAELKKAILSGDSLDIEEELGDLLFSVVNVSRFVKVDSEQALQKAAEKFIARFKKTEALAKKAGTDMQCADLSELDKLWDQAKQDI